MVKNGYRSRDGGTMDAQEGAAIVVGVCAKATHMNAATGRRAAATGSSVDLCRTSRLAVQDFASRRDFRRATPSIPTVLLDVRGRWTWTGLNRMRRSLAAALGLRNSSHALPVGRRF